jgi:hypothetical protein
MSAGGKPEPPHREAGFAGGSPGFPDAAKLQLDLVIAELIGQAEQLIDRLDELRRLSRANAAIVGEVRLLPALRRIADATRMLLAAGHSAVGVVDPDDGRFVAFAQASDQDVGAPAQLDPPVPVFLIAPTRQPAAAGYAEPPDGLRHMLCAPVPAHRQWRANLYAARAEEFSDRDEYLLTAFSASVGLVLDTAFRHERAGSGPRFPDGNY